MTFILKATGGSELGSDRIKVVFMEDQSGRAWPEDILEQSDWGRWRGTGTEGQREDVYMSRSFRAGDDVSSPSTLRRGCSHPHVSRAHLTCLQEEGGNIAGR